MMPAYILRFQLEACSVRDAIVFPLFQRFRVDRRKRFRYATSGCVSFENGEKNLRFQKYQKYPDMDWA